MFLLFGLVLAIFHHHVTVGEKKPILTHLTFHRPFARRLKASLPESVPYQLPTTRVVASVGARLL